MQVSKLNRKSVQIKKKNKYKLEKKKNYPNLKRTECKLEKKKNKYKLERNKEELSKLEKKKNPHWKSSFDIVAWVDSFFQGRERERGRYKENQREK